MAGQEAGDTCSPGDPSGAVDGEGDCGDPEPHRGGEHGDAPPREGHRRVAPFVRQAGEVDDEEPVGELLDETDQRERPPQLASHGDGTLVARPSRSEACGGGTFQAMSAIDELAADLRAAGVRRIHALAWRDLDDPDAGGSEVHADEVLRRWAAAGLDIVLRTSAAAGRPARSRRHGYEVIRRGSRFTVFPRTGCAEVFGRMGRSDALVEIWNGVPWFSPVWYRRPRVTIVHHVHGPMWDQMLPAPLASMGRALEARIAPYVYRRGATVTPSESTREELVELGFDAGRVAAVPNGVEERFTPGGRRSPTPLVIAVGRLAPVKRFHLALQAAAAARQNVPDLRLRLVGDGPLASELHRWVADHEATGWVEFAGYVERDRLVDEYRQAWVVLSASLAEGWGLSLTEAAACATPAVATNIRGHRCSVVDGETGLLAPPEGLGEALRTVLTDDALRWRLGSAAEARARTLTWERTATGVLAVLHAEVRRHRGGN